MGTEASNSAAVSIILSKSFETEDNNINPNNNGALIEEVRSATLQLSEACRSDTPTHMRTHAQRNWSGCSGPWPEEFSGRSENKDLAS